jgi:uncharacterized protein
VILADTNFWLALTFSKHLFHRAASDWFAGRSAESSALFCRSTQQSFLRLLTTEAATRQYDIPPLTNAGAWKIYEGLISQTRVKWAAEPEAGKLESLWKRLAGRETPSPKVWMDAYLAAFAMAGGHQFVTTDRAFTRFDGLDLILLAGGGAKA